MENLYHYEHDNEASASSKPINLELIFPSKVASPVYTGRRICGEVHGGTESIKIMLIDSQTRQQVISGNVSSLKVKMVLIRGDFDGVTTGDSNIWTHEEFKEKIVVNWKNKKNLLLGNLSLVLKNGIGTVGEMRIKHYSKPLKNVKFRLGAMVDDDDNCPFEIKEAITNLFEVKDRRNESKYLGPLSPNDWVWQLVNISRKGPIRKRLESKKVSTVRDFLNMYSSNPQVLQQVCGFKGKKWQMTVNHAKTSLLETMCDANGRIRSSFQQSNAIPSFNYTGSIDFNNNCYKPQPCENDLFGDMMIVDCNFSTQDVEVWDVCILEFEPRRDGIDGASTSVHNGAKGKGDLAKKRWMRLRATIWFWMVSFTKKVESCVCSP